MQVKLALMLLWARALLVSTASIDDESREALEQIPADLLATEHQSETLSHGYINGDASRSKCYCNCNVNF